MELPGFGMEPTATRAAPPAPTDPTLPYGEGMQTAELTIQTPNGEKTVPLVEGQPLFVGRTAECDLYLPSPAVSRRHAVFLTRHGHVGLKDLDSANGTYLNGRKITKPIRLKDGDVIQVATFVMHFAKKADENGQTVILSSSILDGHSADGQAAVNPADITISDNQSTPPPPAEPTFADDDAAADDEAGSGEFFANIPDAPVRTAPAEAEAGAAAEAPAPTPATDSEKPEAAPARTHLDGRGKEGESNTRVIARPPRPRPTRPNTIAREIDEEVVGDGDGDHLMVDDTPPEEADGELALTKAAAEAGLVGEFVPEEDTTRPNGGGGSPDLSGVSIDTPKPYTPAENAIPVDEKFREAIEARLALFSFLADLKQERDGLLAANPGAPDAVKSEFSRQDREMDKLPTADQCDSMIEKRTARRRDLKEKIKEAKKNGTKPPPRPSKLMIEAEDMAINQWTILSQSFREVLPSVFAQGYRLTGQEPLAQAMEEAGLDGKTLLGGGAYLLALGELLEETKYNRAYVKSRLNEVEGDKKSGGGGGKRFGLFGGKNDDEEDEDEDEDDDTPSESPEELRETEKYLGQRVNWINQESLYIEQMLIKEFWDIYTKMALHYLPNHEEMTVAVRAFLRHGVIGFMPWWLKPEVREFIMEDCNKDVVHHMEVSRKITNILYADEYLAAVMNMECTPAMDENLEINERNSPNWKADKALRKLINARSQKILMTELMNTLGDRIAGLEAETAKLDDRLKGLLHGQKNYKQIKNELSQQRQSYRVEVSKLTNLGKKIKEQTLATLDETIAETEERFASGELPKPSREFLIERECAGVRRIGRLLANLKERFMPLVMRDNFHINTDCVNDRLAINGEIADIERRDPAVFLEIIVPSKKRANRVDIRISPVIVLVPSAGVLAFSWNPRQKPEDGRLGIPTCFIRPRLRERQLTYLISDFRWDTSKASAGMDVMNSETIVAAFMSVRWDWRKRSKEGREKGLIYTDQNDRTNWRRVYEAYLQTAYDGGKKLYQRNYDFYERIIGRYFDMPENVELLRK